MKETLHSLLKTHFGYDQFRPQQEQIVTTVLEKRDAFVLMPTGGGKSLCYQLPALAFDGLTIVVSPLIALMKDQVDTLRANGIQAAYLNSTLDKSEINLIQKEASEGKTKLLYIAPERLGVESFREWLGTLNVSLLAIDEAHCISEWGHDFRPDYRNLKRLRHQFSRVPAIALTATATEKVRQDIVEQLELQRAEIFVSSFNRANLSYHVQRKLQSFNSLLDLLQKYEGESTIVYCFSRNDTEKLAYDLNRSGIKALPYHAGLSNDARHENQEKFIRDEVQVMVATIAFGMGIDKPDIRLIVHMDLPKTLEGYYQETGRAGRDGLPSECVLFYSYGDKLKQDFFINQIINPKERLKAQEKLGQVIDFCQRQSCRRRYLLEYFGEIWNDEVCGSCDVCLNPREQFDATEVTAKILSAVIRTGQRYGLGYVIDILVGNASKKVKERGHDQLSVFGVVTDFTPDQLKELTNGLIQNQFLIKTDGEYATYRVGESGIKFLKQKGQLTLFKPADDKAVIKKKQSKLDYDVALFEKLRVLRKSLADERNVPPFVIFGDVTLQEMATYYPQSEVSLGMITGVGASKLAQFGPDFLTAITTHAQQHNLEEKPLPHDRLAKKKTSQDRPMVGTGSTYAETRLLLSQGLPLEEIANQRGVTLGTVINHIEKLLEAGESLSLDTITPPAERYSRIQEAFETFGMLSLSTVRQELGEEYSFDEIRLARIIMKNT